MFNEKDLQQIAARGLTPEAVEVQIENFRRGFPFLGIVRAASPAEGVVIVDAETAERAIARYEKAAEELKLCTILHRFLHQQSTNHLTLLRAFRIL